MSNPLRALVVAHPKPHLLRRRRSSSYTRRPAPIHFLNLLARSASSFEPPPPCSRESLTREAHPTCVDQDGYTTNPSRYICGSLRHAIFEGRSFFEIQLHIPEMREEQLSTTTAPPPPNHVALTTPYSEVGASLCATSIFVSVMGD